MTLRQPQPLTSLLELQQTGPRCFRGVSHPGRGDHVYGGQLIAQALIAAGDDVAADRRVRSLQARFLRRARRGVALEYAVGEGHDGRTTSFRRVVTTQGNGSVFDLTAIFQIDRDGVEHQDLAPDVPPPHALAPAPEMTEWKAIYPADWSTLELRVLPPRLTRPGIHATARSWARIVEDFGDEPLRHAAALAYVSDMPILSAALATHRLADTPQLALASADHVMWFHRPCRVNDWLLFEQTSPSGAAGRLLGLGKVFAIDGHLVASVAQEGVLGADDPAADLARFV